jgi:uncharacterized protein with HEPN domain
MPRDYRAFIDDILEAIQRIEQYTDKLDIEDFPGLNYTRLQ